jgi:hypothetical protein
VPAAAAEQVPTLPTAVHVWQVPVQAVLQQTPSTQLPLVQSAFAAQAVPFASWATQTPAEQKYPATQSVLAVHEVTQAETPHMKAPHELLVTVRQVPVPSQVRAGVSVPAVHDPAAQTVPAAQNPQAPAPLHMPSCPQPVTTSAVHSSFGSVPAAIAAQVPFA